MELIFPLAALVVLCFVLVVRKVLITLVFWLLLSSAPMASGLSLQCFPPSPSRLGVGKILGGDRARTADPN